MKRYPLTFLMAFVAAFLTTPLQAQVSSGPWTYRIDEANQARLLSYSGPSGPLVIPEQVDGFPIRIIGSGDSSILGWANNSVTSVSIPSGATQIADLAFHKAVGLQSVSIGPGVTNIGKWAFSESGLTSLVVPGTVNRIQFGAFNYCSSLTNVALMEGVETVEEFAFYVCTNIQTATLPGTLRNIGGGTFAYAANLTNVVLNYGLTNVASGMFRFCEKLTSISLPSSILSIEGGAFDSSGLTSIIVPDGVQDIPSGLFYGCSNLTDVVLGGSVTNIGSHAFFGCSALTHFTIPDSVTTVGPHAFDGCSNLRSFIVGRSVTNVGPPSVSLGTNLATILFKGDYLRGFSFTYGTSAKVFYMEGAKGWENLYPNHIVSIRPFKPVAEILSLGSNSFSFKWHDADLLPMNVLRSESLNGPWTVISSNNTTGTFTDTAAPTQRGFYRAVLP